MKKRKESAVLLNLEKMVKTLAGEVNDEQLKELIKKNGYQEMFAAIMEWTDLSHADEYDISEYVQLLNKLPQYVENILCYESNIHALADKLAAAKNCSKRRRLL